MFEREGVLKLCEGMECRRRRPTVMRMIGN